MAAVALTLVCAIPAITDLKSVPQSGNWTDLSFLYALANRVIFIRFLMWAIARLKTK
jgi:hypothetical protein